MALNVGDRLGHYDVTALIGQGGMGEVYIHLLCSDAFRPLPRRSS